MLVHKQNNAHYPPMLFQFFRRSLVKTFDDLRLTNQRDLDYMACVLTHFARTDQLFRINQLPSGKLETIVETLLEIELLRHSDNPLSENEEILIRKHVGDFALFMSGIFREYLQRRGILEYYLHEGSHSYNCVFEYTYKFYGDETKVFLRLGRKFEEYSGALDYLKKVYFYYPDIDEKIRRVLQT